MNRDVITWSPEEAATLSLAITARNESFLGKFANNSDGTWLPVLRATYAAFHFEESIGVEELAEALGELGKVNAHATEALLHALSGPRNYMFDFGEGEVSGRTRRYEYIEVRPWFAREPWFPKYLVRWEAVEEAFGRLDPQVIIASLHPTRLLGFASDAFSALTGGRPTGR